MKGLTTQGRVEMEIRMRGESEKFWACHGVKEESPNKILKVFHVTYSRNYSSYPLKEAPNTGLYFQNSWSWIHFFWTWHHFKIEPQAFLVVQRLSIYLAAQGVPDWYLIPEDAPRRGAAKPVCHSYWVSTLEPESCKYWAHVPAELKPMYLEPMLHMRNHCSEKPAHPN